MPAAPGDGAGPPQGRHGDPADRGFTSGSFGGSRCCAVSASPYGHADGSDPRRREPRSTALLPGPSPAHGPAAPRPCPRPGPSDAAPTGWPGPAMRLRTRDQLPDGALAVADLHHPAVRAGAREFLLPLQAVHPADTVLVIGLTPGLPTRRTTPSLPMPGLDHRLPATALLRCRNPVKRPGTGLPKRTRDRTVGEVRRKAGHSPSPPADAHPLPRQDATEAAAPMRPNPFSRRQSSRASAVRDSSPPLQAALNQPTVSAEI